VTSRTKLTVVAALATMLAALSLSATFRTTAWFWPAVAGVTVASAGCALGRRLELPRPLVPFVGLIGLIVLITWLFADDAILGLIPGPGAIRSLNEIAVEAGRAMARYSSPAPTTTGLLLVTTAGVGFVALVVDTLAVTYRSAALAGVPLLALYAVPVTIVRPGVPWLLFVLGAVGWLALMLTEGRDRLSGWGRSLGRREARVSVDTVSDASGRPVGATALSGEPLGIVGRRIGAAALGLAVIVPAILPTIGGSLFGQGGTGSGPGKGSGHGTSVTVNPLVQIGGDLNSLTDAEVLRYTTNDPQPEYLRMATLDTFDGKVWQPASLTATGLANDPMPRAPGLSSDVPSTEVTTTISLTKLSQTWAPVLYPTTGINGLDDDWAYDGATRNIFSVTGISSQGNQYEVTSRHLQPTTEQLKFAGAAPADLKRRYTALPERFPESVALLAKTVTAGAATDFDKALQLQAFFLDDKNGFRYNTRASAGGDSPLVDFLNNRQGFCQQFAGTFAAMARSLGLPTRVNVGFTRGTLGSDGSYLVTLRNAHAWPEVYFEGVGWVRFEPTPGPTGVATPAWAPPVGAGTNTPGGTSTGTGASRGGSKNDQLTARENARAFGGAAVGSASAAGAGRGVTWLVAGGVLVALALLLAPGGLRLLRRRRRLHPHHDPRAAVDLAWAELADAGIDLGNPWSSARTPRRTAEWLSSADFSPEASAAVRRLARALERVRYAPADLPLGVTEHSIAADARIVLAAMEQTASSRARWQARLLPRSVLSAAAVQVADGLDALDRLGARLSAVVRRSFGQLRPPRTTS